MLRLAQTRYPEVNHAHLSELLRDREGIDIGRTTLRRILVGAGLKSPRHRPPPRHRVRPQRMPSEGMLIQVDGSHHRWLGDRGSPFALSPQAKGRVERTAGTFQDRLVAELRIAGATTIEEANVGLKDFLVRFNERFGVAAQHPEVALPPVGAGRVPG